MIRCIFRFDAGSKRDRLIFDHRRFFRKRELCDRCLDFQFQFTDFSILSLFDADHVIFTVTYETVNVLLCGATALGKYSCFRHGNADLGIVEFTGDRNKGPITIICIPIHMNIADLAAISSVVIVFDDRTSGQSHPAVCEDRHTAAFIDRRVFADCTAVHVE